MSSRFAARLAWSLCAAGVFLLVVALILLLLEKPTNQAFPWQAQAIDILGIMGVPVLGGIIASRRPEHPIGWIWLAIGLGFALSSFAGGYAAYSPGPGSLPASRTVGTLVAEVGSTVGFIFVAFLFLLFPTGRLPSRRWRVLMWTVAAAGALYLIPGSLQPGRRGPASVENPFGVGGAEGEVILALANASITVLLFATFLSALSLVFRYRRAAGIERQQIKWFAYAAVLFCSLIPLDFLGLRELLGVVLWVLLNNVASLGVYAAVGVAILRYRLYDIDVLINRTLVYGPLTAMLAAVYFGGVAVTQATFRALTGQEEQPQLAIVVSTLVIAALFTPLRRRIQSFIDRRFYRRKYDAAKTLAAFNARLRDDTELDTLTDDLVGVVREAMQPAHVGFWLRPPIEVGKVGREGREQ